MHVGEVSDNETAAATTSPARDAPSWALATFAVVFVMSLLDYTDRWVLAAVLPQLELPPAQGGLGLSNEQSGWLATWFLVSYAAFSPLMGYAGDRMRRTRLLFFGVALWSLASVGSGLAQSYSQLRVARALLGIGEATYGVIAPTILMDLFRRETRSRVLSLFYLSMPLGGALGMTLGGWIGKHYGWHAAFFVVGVPGLIAAFGMLALPEPVRGISEGVDAEKLRAHERAGASRADYIDLMVNSSYTYSVLGMAFYTFAIGGLAYYLPKFLIFGKGIEQVRATSLLGVTTLFAAITGMSAGGWLADRLAKRDPRALFVVPGVAMLASIPFIVMTIYAERVPLIFAGVFFSEVFMFINTGPCNAVIANVVMPGMRSAAYAVALFAVHVLGDIWSPPLMGWVSDTFGKRDAMLSVFGRMLSAVGALPSTRAGRAPENLMAGMLVVVPAVFLSGGVLLAGARHLPREMALMRAKLEARPRHAPSPRVKPLVAN